MCVTAKCLNKEGVSVFGFTTRAKNASFNCPGKHIVQPWHIVEYTWPPMKLLAHKGSHSHTYYHTLTHHTHSPHPPHTTLTMKLNNPVRMVATTATTSPPNYSHTHYTLYHTHSPHPLTTPTTTPNTHHKAQQSSKNGCHRPRWVPGVWVKVTDR